MKKYFLLLLLSLSFLSACDMGKMADMESASFSSSMAGGGNTSGGLITAGEWSDLKNWSFWKDLMGKSAYKQYTVSWSFYPIQRVSVAVTNTNQTPVCDAKVVLKKGNQNIWEARTDNTGKAELWTNLHNEANEQISNFQIVVNDGQFTLSQVKTIEDGVNQITLNNTTQADAKVDISFVIDVTSSMADELEYLKKELQDVLNRVKQTHSNFSIATSAVLYRDEGDEYVTKTSGFTNNISNTINFIKEGKANGGGNYPEAVHSGLHESIQNFQWSNSAKARILFLILDAPPHQNPSVIGHLQQLIKIASSKGIKIIPIAASGVDKSTEFLMRFFSIATNGTYVFITNHSGIGNDHQEATVGSYQVEYLNNLMVRLINQYLQ
ncbi:MAG: VWA domain-containing protein [Bacteroidetes bacterium]|nr:MAG: VWA domain-containing protein [Bacteroidota bacterium]